MQEAVQEGAWAACNRKDGVQNPSEGDPSVEEGPGRGKGEVQSIEEGVPRGVSEKGRGVS